MVAASPQHINIYITTFTRALLLVLPLLPTALWLNAANGEMFNSATSFFRALGQLSALLGASLFSLNFILSARISWIEEAVNGLPKMYVIHHLIGGVAFILLLVHPMFLGLQYLPISASLAAEFFAPDFNDVPKMLGVVAMSVLSSLLLVTFYLRIAYERWKMTHQWLGLALVIASLHVYLIPGNLDMVPGLRFYMLTIMMAGIVAFMYRTLFGRWLVRRYNYVVVSNQAQANIATEITLKPINRSLQFRSGQFFFLRVKEEKGFSQESHPFSFTGPPETGNISFAAKTLGDFTALLPSLHDGVMVDVEGPYGRFLLSRSSRPQVWIAGGIGITPFMSRIRSKSKHPNPITLYYVVKNKKQAVFINELQDYSKRNEAFRLVVWESDEKGRANLGKLGGSNPGNDCDYFICGPKEIMRSVKKELKTAGVASSSIFVEEFALY